jgi:hypothetical protein
LKEKEEEKQDSQKEEEMLATPFNFDLFAVF